MVVSAPSGGGKTTLCRRVMAELGGVEFSVSHTTRGPRPNERDGADYHFVSDDEFSRLVAQNAFLEWAHVHGKRYGTARVEADSRLGRGIDVFFDIDVQGGRQIAERLPGAVLVFLVPPNLGVLEERLRARRSDAADEIDRRLAAARREMEEAATFYTHWIVNDDLTAAAAELRSILVAERIKRRDAGELVRRLMTGKRS